MGAADHGAWLGTTVFDGALDAIAHTFEVFCGAKGDAYAKASEIAETAIDLVASYAKVLIADPKNLEASYNFV